MLCPFRQYKLWKATQTTNQGSGVQDLITRSEESSIFEECNEAECMAYQPSNNAVETPCLRLRRG